jgi:hypothetical protein
MGLVWTGKLERKEKKRERKGKEKKAKTKEKKRNQIREKPP